MDIVYAAEKPSTEMAKVQPKGVPSQERDDGQFDCLLFSFDGFADGVAEFYGLAMGVRCRNTGRIAHGWADCSMGAWEELSSV